MLKQEVVMTLKKIPCIVHNVTGYLVDKEWMGKFKPCEVADGYEACYVYGVRIRPFGNAYDKYGFVDCLTDWNVSGLEYWFLTNSNIERMYICDLDSDVVFVFDCSEIKCNDDHPAVYVNPEGEYIVRNKFLYPMKEYVFDRTDMTNLFVKYIQSNEKAFERLEECLYSSITVGDFRAWTEEEETYVLHLPSGTIVGWYKFYHIGRCNFCNKPDMKITDLENFFILLRNQLLEEADIPKEPIKVDVKVTTVDNSEYYKPVGSGPKVDVDISSMYPPVTKGEDYENNDD